MQTESQAELNTLIEYDFHDAFKIVRSNTKVSYARKATSLRVIVASRPTVIF
jgi:hypothetical protein